MAVRDSTLDPARLCLVGSGKVGSYAYCGALRPWLREHLREFDGVVIHGAWTYPGWAAMTECRRIALPYGYYPHGMLERWAVRGQGPVKNAKKLLYWKLRERATCAHARWTFFTTESEQQRTQQVFNIPSPQRILRPFGISPAVPKILEPATPSLRQPQERRIALFLGRLHPKKNLELLLNAWRSAGMRAPWRLVIAGSGEPVYEARLRRLAASIESSADIQFAGFVSGTDKRYLLQRSEWFLLPSNQENFGIAVLEAVEHGCAVAISEAVCLAECFRPDSAILPVRLRAWAEFFRGRMQNAEWRDRTRYGDRAHLAQMFDIQRIVAQWTEAMVELCS